jgi:hypothetical protein
MVKVFFSFMTGVVVGAFYIVGEPNIIVKNVVVVLKALFSSVIG